MWALKFPLDLDSNIMITSHTIEFLRDLKANNNKEWFDHNRKRYDITKAEYLSLAGTLLEKMKKIDPGLEMLTAKECIFRINRDIRFSADKSPYKTNLGIVLQPGGKRLNRAAYYFHIEEGACFAGGGLWMPEGSLLQKVRQEIHYFYPDLVAILTNQKFKNTYNDLDVEPGQKLTRPPKGYDATDPAIEYIKLKSFTASTPVADSILASEKLVNTITEYFEVLKPLIQYINRGLDAE